MNNHFSHIITISIQQQTFSVFKLSGEESLSKPFHFKITLILPMRSTLDFNLYMSATLSIINYNNNERIICGIITKIQHLGLFDTEQIHLIIHLQPLLAKLQIAKSLQFFQNLSVLELTRQLLQNIGYNKTQIKFLCNKSYATLNYIIQTPNETDLAFLHRLLAYAGIFYWCDTNHKQEILYFSDNNQACSRLIKNELYYIPPNGLNLYDSFDLSYGYFHHMQVHTQLATTTFSLNTFNPDISTKHLETSQSITTNPRKQIEKQHISQIANNHEELKQETFIRAQRAMIDNWQLNLRGNVSLLSPSQIFHLNAFNFQKSSQFNNDYLVIKLKHFAQQPSDKYGFGSATGYHNEATLIKANVTYCDTLSDLPKIPSCWMGHIESDKNYPLLDENGNYRLQVHYDISKKSNIYSKPTINRLSNYGSTQQQSSIGSHLPLAADTEILLSCMSCNFNRPIIIGTLSNFIFRNPVTSLNKTQNKLLSQQNNLLLLDDMKNYQKIHIATENLQNQIELNNELENPSININTEQGSVNLNAFKNIILQCDNSLIEQCGNNWTHCAQQNYSVQTQNQSIFYQSGEDQQYAAQHNILINSQNNLNMNSEQKIVIKCISNMHFSISGTSTSYFMAKENIKLNCGKSISIIGTSNSEIRLLNSGNGISISSDGIITCFGNHIELQTLSGLFFSTPPTY